MKKLYSFILCILISGCSSSNYIYPREYSEALQEKCLEKLTKVSKDDEINCALEAEKNIRLAHIIYEVRAEKDFEKCKEENNSNEAAKLCFEKVQKEHYERYFSSHYLNK